MLHTIVRWHPPLMLFALSVVALIPVTAIGILVRAAGTGSGLLVALTAWQPLFTPDERTPPAPAVPATSCGTAAAVVPAVTATARSLRSRALKAA